MNGIKGTMHAQMQGPRNVQGELASDEFPHIAMVEGIGIHFDGLARV